MSPAVALSFVLLAALWGGSFLVMRVCGPEFGPVALAAVRTTGATALLLPLLIARGEAAALWRHRRAVLFLGITSSALPFVCFATATLAINAGLASVLNATTPIWSVLVASAWLGERPDRSRTLGIAIAFAGVVWLVGDKADLKPGEHGVSPALAIAACLAATLLYGWSSVYVKRYLGPVPPLAQAAGSQIGAALVLALPATWAWPARPPSGTAWSAAIALALLSTGVAYLLFFRLIARVGPARAVSVTFLIPVFGVLFGTSLLHEPFGLSLAAGCAVILLGTSLATGFWQPRWLAGPAVAR